MNDTDSVTESRLGGDDGDMQVGLISNAEAQRSCSKSRCAAWTATNIVLILTMCGALLGFIVGALVGLFNPSSTAIKLMKLPGNVFVRILKALVLPLVMTCIVVGISSLHKTGGSGKLGLRTFVLYTFTTIIAVITGLILVAAIQPGRAGVSVSPSEVKNSTTTIVDATIDIVFAMFPENLVEAAVKMDILGLIVFSIVFSVIALRSGKKGRLLLDICAGMNKVVMKIVHYVMFLTPIGVFSLLSGRLAESGSSFWTVLAALGLYVVTVLSGLLVHAVITLPLLYLIFLRRNPFRYLLGVGQALMTAFGTASSSATLPVTLREVQRSGVSAAAARFVLPLGATVNMDGTALYEAVAALFIAQVYGVPLGFGSAIVVALTAVLASVGAAGIPEAGLVTMILVLKSVDLPVEGIGLLLPVDWLLDRCRTTANVWGDIIAAAIIDKFVPRADRDLLPVAANTENVSTADDAEKRFEDVELSEMAKRDD
eukprot:TRINITY_DN7474_c0_g1_i1.p1 TRINITY_DN7474_c0_g1~~TRINITY_DN7474_c0_g1_i1.p1  ORF type:complete len:485 (+),score=108.28 TRINITY_DN7474_c0_g1_i1:58-1512(+)